MGNLLVFTNLVCLVLTIMIVWFKTNAFAEYCNLFGFKKILLGYEKETNNLTFPQHLYVKSKTLITCSICKFIISLISCPLCFSLWLSAGAASLYGTILLTPLFYVAVLVGYFLTDRIIN